MSVIQILTLQTLETKDDGTRDAFFKMEMTLSPSSGKVSSSLFQQVNVFPS